MRKGLLIMLCLAVSSVAGATTINVPSEYPTIQAGIDAAADGDTVLAADGTYTGSGNKNIDFRGKGILVISENGVENCIIDCENYGRGFYFHCGEDSNSVLSGFTITNGELYSGSYWDACGGGILIDDCSPLIENCMIINNVGYSSGGGVYCHYGAPIITGCLISGNSAQEGGGINTYSSSARIENCVIEGNIIAAEYGAGSGIACGGTTIVSNCTITGNQGLEWQTHGGGVFCCDSALIMDCIISWNSSDAGGGLFCDGTSRVLNCSIQGNSGWGGGIACALDAAIEIENCLISGNNGNGVVCASNSVVCLSGCNISYNQGIGIDCNDGTVIFDSENRCSVYFNRYYENAGNDLYWNGLTPVNVFLDTFTVLSPTNTYASPIEIFSFDILHEVYAPVNADLYISPGGDNSNSGLTPAEPLKNIHYALNQIQADSLNPHTIYLSPGTFGAETTGEIFPLQWLDYVSLQGSGQDISILDGNNHSGVLRLWYGGDYSTISHITITNGNIPYSGEGAGIYCFGTSPTIEYCTIRDNTVGEFGMGAGITCHYNASPIIRYCVISGNIAGDWGGGLWCHNGANPTIENCTFYGNSAYWGGGIFFSTNPIIKNCIFWNNIPDQIHNVIGDADVTYSDVMGGYTGEGNIDADPLFEDPSGGIFQLTWANFPVPDSTRSPCIDAGDPNSPFDPDSTEADLGAYYFDQSGTSVSRNNISNYPSEFKLFLPYPNPFNPATTISFALPEAGMVELKVYDIMGREVRAFSQTPLQGWYPAGYNEVVWDAKGQASGVYFVRLAAGGLMQTRKMLLVK